MRRYNPGAAAPYCFVMKCSLCGKRSGGIRDAKSVKAEQGVRETKPVKVERGIRETERATGRTALCSGTAGAYHKLPVRVRFAP